MLQNGMRGDSIGHVTKYTMLSKQSKENELKKVQRHDSDTGSPEAQVALILDRLKNFLCTYEKQRRTSTHVMVCFQPWLTAANTWKYLPEDEIHAPGNT